MSTEPIKNNSKMLYLQARYQYEKAIKAFEDGSIKTEATLIQTVFGAFQEFFTSMGKPQMIPRYAPEQGPPWSEDYNSMSEEIRADLELLFQELEVLAKSLFLDFNHNTMQHDIIQKEYDTVFDKMRDLELYAGFSTDGTFRFGRDDFLNGSKIDYDRIVGKPLEITGNGVTLPLKGDPINVAKDATVTIVTGNRKFDSFILGSDSNGFPGNNSEVTVIADPLISNVDSYSFVARENNHGDYGATIDGDVNTWFEYERVNLRDHEKVRVAKNIGWEYQVTDNKTLTYAADPDNGILKLHLQIVLDKLTTINQINLSMYTPPNYGARPAIVDNILVSDGVNAPRSILDSAKEDTDYIFHFQPTQAKVVSVLLSQPEKYFTDIGHIYYEKKMNAKDKTEYVFDTITKQYKPKYSPRVEGPLINLQDLGVNIDINNTDINAYYPMKSVSSDGYSLQNIVNQLTTRIDQERIEMGVERYEGWRYCIGVRDIEILSCEYEEEGELVTQPFYFDKPLDKISMSVQEALPAMFSENSNIKYDWMTYYFSIEDGGGWYPITPLEHEMTEGLPPKIYTIRKVSSSDEALDNKEGYIESEYPVYSLRLRVLVKRPADASVMKLAAPTYTGESKYGSPKLKNYQMHVEFKEDFLDSAESRRKTNGELEIGEIPERPIQPPVEEPEEPEVPEPEIPDEPLEPLHIELDNQLEELCSGADLVISGVMSGPLPVQIKTLLINGTEIDPNNLGVAPEVSIASVEPTCMFTSKASYTIPSFYAMSTVEEVFNWVIPYWKLQELGIEIDNTISVKVIAFDGEQYEEVELEVTIIDCSAEQLPEELPCYPLESIIVQYYDEEDAFVNDIEVGLEDLPFEFDNGEGVKTTIGWSQETKGVVLHVTGGDKKTSSAVAIQAIGIRFKKYVGTDDVETLWAEYIIDESYGNRNTIKLIGDPELNDLSWVSKITDEADYTEAPILGQLNDYIIVAFDNTWGEMGCNVESDYKPLPVTITPGESIRACKKLVKIAFQYFDDSSMNLKYYEVPLNSTYKMTYTVPAKNGPVELFVGWYESKKGPLIKIKTATGDNNILLTALGVVYEDEYGIIRSEYMSAIKHMPSAINNSTLMLGENKSLGQSWMTEVEGGVYSNAPALGIEKYFVIGGLNSDLLNSLCMVENPIDDIEGFEPPDTEKPVITFTNAPTGTICYVPGTTTMNLSGTISDESLIERWDMYQDGTLFESGTGNAFSGEVKITYPAPDPAGRYADQSTSVTVIAKDTFGNEITKEILYNFTDCSEPPTPCGASTQAGNEGVKETFHNLGSIGGHVVVTYNMYDVPDALEIYYQDTLVATTNGQVSGEGSLSFDYVPVNGDFMIKAIAYGNMSGTGWNYTVNCPVPN